MNQLRIGIVEDEMIIADVLSLTLRKLGYEIAFAASNYSGAVKLINAEKPDLVLLDINLGTQKDGIDIAKYVREQYSMPIIFLTANSDAATIQRAKEVKPNAYLVKPFSKDHLFAAIEIAVVNHALSATFEESILVKDGYSYVKVFVKEIKYLSSDQNYVTLNLLSNERIMVRSTLTEILEKLDARQFVKINRGSVVNISYVTKIETESVFVDQKAFAINKTQRDTLIQLIEKSH